LTPFHGADGAGALQGIGQQWPIGFGAGVEGCGPSQPWPCPRLTPFHGADGADALQGTGQQWPIGFGAGLEGCGPSQPWPALD